MNIYDLRDKPEHLNTLAHWHQQEWGYINPGTNIQDRINKMQMFLGDNFLPSMYIAIDEQLLGSSAIVAHDMETRPDLSPWLASVYVDKASRQQGVGGKLVKYAMQQAKYNQINELFLFTPDQENFYARLGWRVFEKTLYRNHAVTIMQVKLSDD